MYFVLSPENTSFLDRLVRTTDSEFITFSWDSPLEVQLTAQDLSQLTIIKLQPTFFEKLQGDSGTVSIPTTRFYQPNMRSLKVSIVPAACSDLDSRRMIMEYTYADIRHTKVLSCLSVDVFDLDFVAKKSFDICLSGLGDILGKGPLEVSTGSRFIIQSRMTTVIVDSHGSQEEIQFRIEADRLRSILGIADKFYESSLCFSEETSPLNIILQTPEIHYSTFVSIE